MEAFDLRGRVSVDTRAGITNLRLLEREARKANRALADLANGGARRGGRSPVAERAKQDGRAVESAAKQAARVQEQAAKQASRAQADAARRTFAAHQQNQRLAAQAARDSSRVQVQAARDAARQIAQIQREAARRSTQAGRDAARTAQQAARESTRLAEKQARDAQRLATQTARAQQQAAREATRIAERQAREAQRLADQTARAQQRAAQVATRLAERQAREAQRLADQTARAQQRAADRAARAQADAARRASDAAIRELNRLRREEERRRREQINAGRAAGGQLAQGASTASTAGGMAVAGGLFLATREAIRFEDAFTGVTKTVNATDAQMKALSRGIREMATQIPVGTTELSAIAQSAGQLGIHVPNLLSFTRVIADLGKSTNLASEEGATQLARYANITRMSQSQFSNLGSSLVDLGNNFATTEAEIMEMSLRLASAGSLAGISAPKILGFATSLSSMGINAEAGGTAMSKAFQKFETAVRKGGATLEVFGKTSGMTGKEFQKAFRDDASGAILAFVTGLSKLKKAGGDVNGVLTDVGMKNAYISNAMRSLAANPELLARALKKSDQAWRSNTALAIEAGRRYATTGSRILMAENKLKDFGITVGSSVVPALNSLLRMVKPTLDRFNNLSPAAQESTVKMVAFGGAALLLAGRIKPMVDTIMLARTAIIGLRAAIVAGQAAGASWAVVLGALGAAALPILAAALIAATVAGGLWLINQQKNAEVAARLTAANADLKFSTNQVERAFVSLSRVAALDPGAAKSVAGLQAQYEKLGGSVAGLQKFKSNLGVQSREILLKTRLVGPERAALEAELQKLQRQINGKLGAQQYKISVKAEANKGALANTKEAFFRTYGELYSGFKALFVTPYVTAGKWAFNQVAYAGKATWAGLKSGFAAFGKGWTSAWGDLWDGIAGKSGDALNMIVGGAADKLSRMWSRLLAGIADKWNNFKRWYLGQSANYGETEGPSLPAAPGVDGARAEGGPVTKNKTYLVGEKGPELFVPRSSGTIVTAAHTAQLHKRKSSVQNDIDGLNDRIDTRAIGLAKSGNTHRDPQLKIWRAQRTQLSHELGQIKRELSETEAATKKSARGAAAETRAMAKAQTASLSDAASAWRKYGGDVTESADRQIEAMKATRDAAAGLVQNVESKLLDSGAMADKGVAQNFYARVAALSKMLSGAPMEAKYRESRGTSKRAEERAKSYEPREEPFSGGAGTSSSPAFSASRERGSALGNRIADVATETVARKAGTDIGGKCLLWVQMLLQRTLGTAENSAVRAAMSQSGQGGKAGNAKGAGRRLLAKGLSRPFSQIGFGGLQAGDVLFDHDGKNGHTGIYAGGGRVAENNAERGKGGAQRMSNVRKFVRGIDSVYRPGGWKSGKVNPGSPAEKEVGGGETKAKASGAKITLPPGVAGLPRQFEALLSQFTKGDLSGVLGKHPESKEGAELRRAMLLDLAKMGAMLKDEAARRGLKGKAAEDWVKKLKDALYGLANFGEGAVNTKAAREQKAADAKAGLEKRANAGFDLFGEIDAQNARSRAAMNGLMSGQSDEEINTALEEQETLLKRIAKLREAGYGESDAKFLALRAQSIERENKALEAGAAWLREQAFSGQEVGETLGKLPSLADAAKEAQSRLSAALGDSSGGAEELKRVLAELSSDEGTAPVLAVASAMETAGAAGDALRAKYGALFELLQKARAELATRVADEATRPEREAREARDTKLGEMNADLDYRARMATTFDPKKRRRAELENEMKRDGVALDASAIDKIIKREQWVSTVEDLTSNLHGIFLDSFSSTENGFKGICDSMLDGFSKMLHDMAAQYLANWVMQKIFGALIPGGGGASAAVAGSKGGGGVNLRSSGDNLSGGFGLHGSHATGLDRVPFSGYRAELHAGETVLNAQAAEAWRRGEGRKNAATAGVAATARGRESSGAGEGSGGAAYHFHAPVTIQANDTKQFERELPVSGGMPRREMQRRARAGLGM